MFYRLDVLLNIILNLSIFIIQKLYRINLRTKVFLLNLLVKKIYFIMSI
jgi:hypothetical protein